MKNNLKNDSVSEILGTILLLFISVMVLSLIFYIVSSDSGPGDKTFVKIMGKIEGSNLILEHQGGERIFLDAPIDFTLANVEYSFLVGELLNDDNSNNYWNMGERLVFPFEYDVDHLTDYNKIDILAVDKLSNEAILLGPVDLNPVSDLGVSVTVDNPTPSYGDIVTIKIEVFCYGGDLNGSANVHIKYVLPAGLEHINNNSNLGSYDNATGMWIIDILPEDTPAVLTITVRVVVGSENEFLQLAMILDGSGSISSSDWTLMRSGLANAIDDPDIFPHGSSVELTIIQFGVDPYDKSARVEMAPTIVTESNYQDISNIIRGFNQGEGWTPMAAGINLAADTVLNSLYFDVDTRQVLMLVSDGVPTCTVSYGDYEGYNCGNGESNIQAGKLSTEQAVQYAIDTLSLDEDQDEFNALGVGDYYGGPDIEWLNGSIVWPEPGYIAPPFDDGAGWVSHVNTWNEFALRLEEIFHVIFQALTSHVEIYDTFTKDLHSQNDNAILVIVAE